MDNWHSLLLAITTTTLIPSSNGLPTALSCGCIERGSWSALLACCCLSSFSVAADQSLHHQMAKERSGRERALEGIHPRVFSRGCSGGHAAGLLRQSGVVSSLAATTKEIETVHRA